MLLDEEGRERGGQWLREHVAPPTAPASPAQTAENDGPSVEAEHDSTRTRTRTRGHGPAPQQFPQRVPSGESRIAELPEHRGDAPPEPADDSGHKPAGSFLRRHPFAVVAGLLLLVPAAAGSYLYWDYSRHFQSTDDAQIAARQFSIAPQVSGSIVAVSVTDNQQVAAGAVIARIDPRTYRATLDQANAQLTHDQSVLAQAEKNLGRYQYLSKTNSIAQQQVDDQGFVVDQDKATVALDQANVENAQLNLSYTTVTAAQAGQVVNLGAAVGQYVQAGTTLTNFVPDQIWVTANFKETQLDAMRPGQPVTLTIDAYPDRTIRGHVASVQPGSGTAFSLLPAENATGNWVKIVQRVPVKIIMDDPPTDVALGPGMSVDADVRVDPNPSLYERLRARL